jgi:hypothetical protein
VSTGFREFVRRTPTPLGGLAAAAALVFAGCGGGGGETTAASTASGSQQSAAATRGEKSEQGSANQERRSSTSKTKQKKNTSPSTLLPPRQGSKAAAPGVPTSREGDNSIQTYGLEASSAQRAQATALVQAYLDARAARDWAKVCSLLAAKPRAEQRQFAGDVSCAEAMVSFAADARTSVLQEEAQIEVLSFRVGHRYAFLIYRRSDGIFATALSRESGHWKLISVTPNPLE